jgi:hypothetical protein
MNSETFFESSWLKREATSPQEIAKLISFASRCMVDARVAGISDDLRFLSSFDAIVALAKTGLRASGYRTTPQPGAHRRTIESLQYTVHADSEVIRKLLTFSKRAHTASYELAGSISDDDLTQILATTENLRKATEEWLTMSHPELLRR